MNDAVICDHAGKPKCVMGCPHLVPHDRDCRCEYECRDEDAKLIYKNVKCERKRDKKETSET